jgi:hypothetical protein
MDMGCSSLASTASMVASTPSVRALSSTSRTLSGCCLALFSQPALPKSTIIRSVPGEMRERSVAVTRVPAEAGGGGGSYEYSGSRTKVL